MSDYKPQDLDKKWQQRWASARAFEVDADPARPKFYCLEMFAYPSGNAHMGHVRNYRSATCWRAQADARLQRPYSVRLGRRSGLPAENERSRAASILRIHARQYRPLKGSSTHGLQLRLVRELATCDPEYLQVEPVALHPDVREGVAYRRKSS